MDSKSGDPSDLQNDPNQDLYTDDREPQEMDMEQSDEDIASHHDAEVENGSEEIKQHRLHDDNHDDHHQKQQHHHHHRRDNHSQNHHHHRQHDDTGLHERFDTNIIQVTNISPSATLEQIYLLFGFLGDILHVELYQSDQNPDNNFKVCFVEFAKSSSVLMAQHLTNTVFIDRGLVVVPYNESSKIPDRDTAIASVIASNLSTKFNCGVVNQATTATGGAQVVATIDPRLTALGLPQYPQLPINTDPARIEEIRRTVYIGNLDSTLPPDQVLKFFNGIGEVKYIRMAGDDTQPTRFAFVEFTHQSSVANALQQNGFKLGSRPLKINHSNNAIVKPQLRTDIDDGSKKARDIRSTSRDLDSRDRHSSRYTGGRDRERDRDRDRYHDRRLSRDYKQSRRSRSRDRDVIPRRRSRSRERVSRRSRSRDKISRRRSRSRDSKRRRSVSRSRERSKQKHHKSSRR